MPVYEDLVAALRYNEHIGNKEKLLFPPVRFTDFCKQRGLAPDNHSLELYCSLYAGLRAMGVK